ncbi:MAG: hypothetical protein L0241_27185 [Planctomycetia bacterium]|nr:hypothetical protein [Planctomycetia bacterium]
MAELIISLRRDALTGRQSIRVGYRADDDAIPHEHEIQHRRLVKRLFPALEIIDSPDAPVWVQRERPAQEPVLPSGQQMCV